MNKKTIKFLSTILAMLCLLFVSACGGSNDENGNTGIDDATATITLQPEISELTVTRGTATGHWKADNTEAVAVKIGSTVKQYKVNSKKVLVSDAPFTWNDEGLKDHSSKTIEAWYPYTASLPTSITVKSNQSSESNFDGSDFLYGTANITYHSNDWVYPITFYHQVAKLHITVTKAADDNRTISSVQINNVYLNGTFTAPSTGNQGTWSTSGSKGTISAYNSPVAWDALLIPQTIPASTAFITINLGGDAYTFTTTEPFAMNGNKQYNCAFTINKNDLRFKITVTPWTTGASKQLPF